MIDFSGFQQVPQPGANITPNISNPAYAQQSYSTPGRYDPNNTTTVIDASQPVSPSSNLGFRRLLNGSVNGSVSSDLPVVVEPASINKTTTTKKRKVGQSVSTEVVNSKDIVEHTLYSDTYAESNNMALGIIAQTDELLSGAKQELDFIRSQRSMKGKYHYLTAMYASMGSLMGTKLQALREINNNIKTVNDMEYRRFKDNKSLEQTDDNKTIMDAYKAFISAPVGAPEYYHPTTMDITAGTTGIIKNDYPENIQKQMDSGLSNYLSHITPEENVMLHDSNPNIEEVIIYDQATGAKYFQWVDTTTNQPIPNMAPSSTLSIEDFVIDPRTRLARNTNLNQIKKVIYKNEGIGSNY